MSGRVACSLEPAQACKAVAYPGLRHTDKIFDLNCEPCFNNLSGMKYSPSFNLAPPEVVLVLIDRMHLPIFPSKYVVTPMRLGLRLPSWESLPLVDRSHNTDIETMLYPGHALWEMQSNLRGVLICDGYFEWKINYEGIAQPYYFYNEKVDVSSVAEKNGINKPIMKLAVIFNRHIDIYRNIKMSCSIVSKEATEDIQHVYPRMPISLNSQDAVEAWINSEVPYETSYEVLKNYNNGNAATGDVSNINLKFHEVDTRFVNNEDYTGKKCIDPKDMTPIDTKFAFLDINK